MISAAFTYSTEIQGQKWYNTDTKTGKTSITYEVTNLNMNKPQRLALKSSGTNMVLKKDNVGSNFRISGGSVLDMRRQKYASLQNNQGHKRQIPGVAGSYKMQLGNVDNQLKMSYDLNDAPHFQQQQHYNIPQGNYTYQISNNQFDQYENHWDNTMNYDPAGQKTVLQGFIDGGRGLFEKATMMRRDGSSIFGGDGGDSGGGDGFGGRGGDGDNGGENGVPKGVVGLSLPFWSNEFSDNKELNMLEIERLKYSRQHKIEISVKHAVSFLIRAFKGLVTFLRRSIARFNLEMSKLPLMSKIMLSIFHIHYKIGMPYMSFFIANNVMRPLILNSDPLNGINTIAGALIFSRAYGGIPLFITVSIADEILYLTDHSRNLLKSFVDGGIEEMWYELNHNHQKQIKRQRLDLLQNPAYYGWPEKVIE